MRCLNAESHQFIRLEFSLIIILTTSVRTSESVDILQSVRSSVRSNVSVALGAFMIDVLEACSDIRNNAQTPSRTKEFTISGQLSHLIELPD